MLSQFRGKNPIGSTLSRIAASTFYWNLFLTKPQKFSGNKELNLSKINSPSNEYLCLRTVLETKGFILLGDLSMHLIQEEKLIKLIEVKLMSCYNQKAKFDFLSNPVVLSGNKAVNCDLIRRVGMGFGLGLLGGLLSRLGVLLGVRKRLRIGNGSNIGFPFAKITCEEGKGDESAEQNRERRNG